MKKANKQSSKTNKSNRTNSVKCNSNDESTSTESRNNCK